MKIAITGATGQLGRLVISKLKEKIPAGNIIALARSAEKAKDLKVEVREFDYEKPSILKPALTGVDTLLLISASEIGKRIAQHKNVMQAVKQSSIKWIVYTSLLHADTSSIGLAAEHLESEKMIRDLGIPFTFLRNGWYTENYTGAVPGAIRGGVLLGSAGNGKISGAARADYADAAVAIVTGKNHQNKIYELAGDHFFTLSDLAAEISRQTGKDIPYKNLSESDYTQALIGFGVPEGFAKAIAGWDTSASKNALFDNSHQLSKLTGRPTTPFSVSVAEAIKG